MMISRGGKFFIWPKDFFIWHRVGSSTGALDDFLGHHEHTQCRRKRPGSEKVCHCGCNWSQACPMARFFLGKWAAILKWPARIWSARRNLSCARAGNPKFGSGWAEMGGTRSAQGTIRTRTFCEHNLLAHKKCFTCSQECRRSASNCAGKFWSHEKLKIPIMVYEVSATRSYTLFCYSTILRGSAFLRSFFLTNARYHVEIGDETSNVPHLS